MEPSEEELRAWLNSIPVQAVMEFVNKRVEGEKKASYVDKIMADPESVKMATWSWKIDQRHGIERKDAHEGAGG